MSKKKKVIIISAVAVVFIAAIVLIWFLIPHGKDKKTVYTDAIKKSLGIKLEKEADEKEKGQEKEKKSLIPEEEIADLLNGHVLKVTANEEGSEDKVELYIKDKDIYALVDAKLGEQLENNQFELLVKDKKIYFTIKEVLKNYYYIDPSEFKDIIDEKAVEKIMGKLEEYFMDSLSDTIKNSEVKKEDSNITINGNVYETTRYSYTFTGEDIYNLVETFINKIKADKELNDLIVESSKKLMKSLEEYDVDLDLDFQFFDLNDIKLDELFDSLLDVLKPIKNDQPLFTHTIQLDENDEMISTTFSINVSEGEMTIPVSLTINSIVDKNDRRFIEVNVSGMGMKVFCLTIQEVSDRTFDIKLDYMGQEYITGKLKIDKGVFEFNLKSTDDKVYLDINFKMDEGYKGSGKIEYKFGEDPKKVINIKVEEVEEMPNVDVSNILPYDKMTDEDSEALKKFTEVTNYYIDGAQETITDFIPSNELKSMM